MGEDYTMVIRLKTPVQNLGEIVSHYAWGVGIALAVLAAMALAAALVGVLFNYSVPLVLLHGGLIGSLICLAVLTGVVILCMVQLEKRFGPAEAELGPQQDEVSCRTACGWVALMGLTLALLPGALYVAGKIALLPDWFY